METERSRIVTEAEPETETQRQRPRHGDGDADRERSRMGTEAETETEAQRQRPRHRDGYRDIEVQNGDRGRARDRSPATEAETPKTNLVGHQHIPARQIAMYNV